MNLEKRLSRWCAAGLITAEQTERIRMWEREQPSAAWVLYGLAGLGITVLLTGVISIVAANWDDIAPATKLSIYFLSLGLLGWGVVQRNGTPGVVRESLLVGFSLYILAGIGLIGQIYHLTSNGYEGLFLWLGCTLPATLLAQRRLLNSLWCGGLTLAVWLWSLAPIHARPEITFAFGSLPWLFLVVGYLLWSTREDFANTARLWGFGLLLVGLAPFANIAWSGGQLWPHPSEMGLEKWLPMVSFCAALGAVFLMRNTLGRALSRAIGATLLVSALLVLPPIYRPFEDSLTNQIVGCALFIGAWSGAAAIAASMHRRRLFDFAAAVIAVRFIIVYFEVFGSLAATGLGLVTSGVVILGIAYLWYRFRRSVARALEGNV